MYRFQLFIILLFAVFNSHNAHCQNLIFNISKVKEKTNVTTLKFYISDVKVHYKNKNTYSLDKYAHLIDVLDTNHTFISLPKTSIADMDYITFNIGIDSTTNVSGAMDGDLDPTKNMYWTWQSGYINIKFEGAIDNGILREYHLGGYAYPNNALQSLRFQLNKVGDTTIYIHLDDFIHSIPDAIPFKFMSPDPKAVYLSKLFTNCLSLEK